MNATTVPKLEVGELEEIAAEIRALVLKTAHSAGAGHVGGSLSVTDILTVLYFSVLRNDPQNPQAPDRDRLVLSKGHCALGLYAALARRGYFPLDELVTFDGDDTRLQMHPDLTRLPGIEMSTGSLGMGLSVGIGMAVAQQREGNDARTFVVIGDGEMQEGMVWEALHVAPRLGLSNLVAVLDHNKLQQFGFTPLAGEDQRDPWGGADLPAIMTGLGWHVIEADGHDVADLQQALHGSAVGKPTFVLANTKKGHGVSFMTLRTKWHTGAPNDEQLADALQELGFGKEGL